MSIRTLSAVRKMSRARRNDSTADDMPTTTVDIESVVKKAVEAAAAVIRSEFTKLLKELSDRVRQVEDSLNDCVSRGFVATNLEERITALEEAARQHQDDFFSSGNSSTEIEAVRQESRGAKVWANDNEQYSRRNNVRIRGLVVNNYDNCKQIVVKLCREKLRVQGIESVDIDVAHPVLRQQSDSASADVGVHKVPTVHVRSLLSQRAPGPRHSATTTSERNRSGSD